MKALHHHLMAAMNGGITKSFSCKPRSVVADSCCGCQQVLAEDGKNRSQL